MPTYDLGMSTANGANYSTQRMQVVADDIQAATEIAESTFPGYKVHHGWCIADPRANKTDDDLLKWMAERTQAPGLNGEKR